MDYQLPDLVTTDELASFLRTTPKTLRRWRNHRQGPAWTRVGAQVRYRRKDVLNWLEQNRAEPVAEIGASN